MAPSRQTIALAAVGSMGKFVCEALLRDDRFDVVVISRGVRSPPPPPLLCSWNPSHVLDHLTAFVIASADLSAARPMVHLTRHPRPCERLQQRLRPLRPGRDKRHRPALVPQPQR